MSLGVILLTLFSNLHQVAAADFTEICCPTIERIKVLNKSPLDESV